MADIEKSLGGAKVFVYPKNLNKGLDIVLLRKDALRAYVRPTHCF